MHAVYTPRHLHPTDPDPSDPWAVTDPHGLTATHGDRHGPVVADLMPTVVVSRETFTRLYRSVPRTRRQRLISALRGTR